MKIDLINWEHYMGGADIFTYLLAKELKNNFNVEISFNDCELGKYDIIHNNNCYKPYCSDILTIHGLYDVAYNKYFIKAVNNANLITAITKTQKDYLEDKFKISISKVIYNFSDMIYYPKKLIPMGNKPIIAYFGRLCKEKGIDLIYKLAKEFKNYNFYLVGFNQDNYEEKYNIKIINHIKNRKALSQIIDLVDVIIHPSKQDNQPISIIDAMFRKKPIISYKLPSIYESFKDNIYYFETEEELIDLLNNVEDIIYNTRKIEKAFNYAYKKFNPLEQSFKYYKLYKVIDDD